MEAWNANMRDGPGKGRGPIQRAFHKIAGPKDSTPVEIKKNYLISTGLVMITFISKALGIASRPAVGMGATRRVELRVDVFQFEMPKDFSRDMHADDMVER